MGMGGNPYGPAGTGKTESVKALGGLFGRQVLVFNCDEVSTLIILCFVHIEPKSAQNLIFLCVKNDGCLFAFFIFMYFFLMKNKIFVSTLEVSVDNFE